MVYTPGGTSGPAGDGSVSPGLALISNVRVNAGGSSMRRSQFTRLVPTTMGSGCGVAIQKLGSGGCAASLTGGAAAGGKGRTALPAPFSTAAAILPPPAAAPPSSQ